MTSMFNQQGVYSNYATVAPMPMYGPDVIYGHPSMYTLPEEQATVMSQPQAGQLQAVQLQTEQPQGAPPPGAPPQAAPPQPAQPPGVQPYRIPPRIAQPQITHYTQIEKPQSQTQRPNLLAERRKLELGEPRQWTTHLCMCCDQCQSCCSVMFCCPCVFCHISESLGEGCCMPLLVSNALMALRLKFRTRENIEGTVLRDWVVSNCCPCCVLCQLIRENDIIIKNHTKMGTHKPLQKF